MESADDEAHRVPLIDRVAQKRRHCLLSASKFDVWGLEFLRLLGPVTRVKKKKKKVRGLRFGV